MCVPGGWAGAGAELSVVPEIGAWECDTQALHGWWNGEIQSNAFDLQKQ